MQLTLKSDSSEPDNGGTATRQTGRRAHRITAQVQCLMIAAPWQPRTSPGSGKLSGHHLHWALDRGGRHHEDLVVPLSADSPARRRSDRWWQVYEPPYDAELHSTSFVTDRTIAFIEESAAADDPWLAWASFPDPHHPMTPPGERFDRHAAADMYLPISIDDPMELSFAHLRHLRSVTADQQRGWVGVLGATDHEMVREAIAATYGMIEFVDHGVGRILGAIERLDQIDDTIVVFTSDHGDMMGDHGLMLKGFIPTGARCRFPS